MSDPQDIFKEAPAVEPEKIPDSIEVAAVELDAANLRADENMAGWQRCMADYANLKRDTERLTAELSKYAIAGFVEKLLPAVESFRKAANSLPKIEKTADGSLTDAKRIEQWIDGVVLIRAQLESALAAAGVTAIVEDNVQFDPMIHEAMLSETHEGIEPGNVLKVLEPGWKLHDRVIRPAKVVVAE